MKSGKYNRVLSMGMAMVLLMIGFACQRSPSAPDDEFIQDLQALSDSSSLKKQNSQANYELTTDSLDALRGYSLEGDSSNNSVNIPPILGYAFVAIIIIGFVLGFYLVIKRIKDRIGDIGYQIKHAKDNIEDVIEQKTPEDMNAEEKESIKTLLSQLDKFAKK